jgi:hypothetical protein
MFLPEFEQRLRPVHNAALLASGSVPGLRYLTSINIRRWGLATVATGAGRPWDEIARIKAGAGAWSRFARYLTAPSSASAFSSHDPPASTQPAFPAHSRSMSLQKGRLP